MKTVPLEDFARDPQAPTAVTPVADAPQVDYEAAYGAGWEDAMAQVEAERSRVSEALSDRLSQIAETRESAVLDTVHLLEPFLHELFDKVLPHAADRGFLGVVLEEARSLLGRAAETVTIQVAPEQAPALIRLVEQGALDGERVCIQSEPALPLSQALLRWDARERLVDMTAVLAAIDEALEHFLATLPPESMDD
jgi:flagellar assembly protein FliH